MSDDEPIRWENAAREAAWRGGWEVVATTQFEEEPWSGNAALLLRKGDTWGVAGWDFGTCPVCDRWEAADPESRPLEFEAAVTDIGNEIVTFDEETAARKAFGEYGRTW